MDEPSLNYRMEGNGTPLLMLHGFGISYNIWSSLLPLLRPHFTLIMVELPGIGLSPMPALGVSYLDVAVDGLEEIRKSLSIQQWDVFSYSSGTRVAERYIQLHPDRVKRCVFLCPAQVSSPKALGLNTLIRLDRTFPWLGNWVLSGHCLRFLIELLGFNFEKNNLSSGWFTEISSQPLDVLKETLRSLPEGGSRAISIPENIPVLFIWGSKDLITGKPPDRSQRDCTIPATHSAPQTAAHKIADLAMPFLLSLHG